MTVEEKNIVDAMKCVYHCSSISQITRTEYDALFPGQHNMNIYYQKLIGLFFYLYPGGLIQEKYFYYENKKAMKELNLSEMQITSCRTKLINEGWITIKREHVNGKLRNLIDINLEKLKEKYRESTSERAFKIDAKINKRGKTG